MFKKAIKKLATDMKLGLTFKDMEAAFHEADRNKNGSLTLDELTLLFRRTSIQTFTMKNCWQLEKYAISKWVDFIFIIENSFHWYSAIATGHFLF